MKTRKALHYFSIAISVFAIICIYSLAMGISYADSSEEDPRVSRTYDLSTGTVIYIDGAEKMTEEWAVDQIYTSGQLSSLREDTQYRYLDYVTITQDFKYKVPNDSNYMCWVMISPVPGRNGNAEREYESLSVSYNGQSLDTYRFIAKKGITLDLHYELKVPHLGGYNLMMQLVKIDKNVEGVEPITWDEYVEYICPPVALTEVSPIENGFIAKWTQGQKNNSYEIQYYPTDNFQAVKYIHIDDINVTETAVTDLKPNTSYTVNVRSYKLKDGVAKYDDAIYESDPDSLMEMWGYYHDSMEVVTGNGSSGDEDSTINPGDEGNPTSIMNAIVKGITDKEFTGSAITQTPVVQIGNVTLSSGSDYMLSYVNNVNVGKATVVISGQGKYTGTITKSFNIIKAVNPLKTSPKKITIKYKKLKKKSQKLAVTKVITFLNKTNDEKTYTLSSAKKKGKSFKKYFKINMTTGNVTVKKGLKKGTYKVKVKVKAAGNANYKASPIKPVTFTVKVK